MKRCLFVLLVLTISTGQAQTKATMEDAVRTVIKAFADARNSHDGQAAASQYSEDGEWIQNHATAVIRGGEDLAKLWGSLPGHVDRTISSIEFPGPNIAVVRVATQYGPPQGLHSEVFILVNDDYRDPSNWKIRIHQTLD